MISGLIAIAGGILAASGLIIGRLPNAKEYIDKITPYTGWIGIIMFFWGIRELYSVLTSMDMISTHFLSWLFWLLTGVSDLGVGFLLGFGLIVKYALSKNETAMEKGQMIRQKLIPFQGGLGILAIVMGVLYIVF